MGCSIWFNLNQLFHLFFFILSFVQLTPSRAQLCPQNQSFALLHFEKQFSFNASASSTCEFDYGIRSYPKLKTWKNDTDCCSWDGSSVIGGPVVLLASTSAVAGYMAPSIPTTPSFSLLIFKGSTLLTTTLFPLHFHLIYLTGFPN